MLKSIENEQEYEAGSKRIEELKQQQLEPGSPESDELEMLTMLIALYKGKDLIAFLKEGKEYVNELHLDFVAA
jgi:antitoxin component HigA of HigAB toxin-antitoxin module